MSASDSGTSEQTIREELVDLTITDAIANAIVVLAPDGTTLYANRVALDLSGIAPEKVGEEGFLQRAAHPDDVDRLLEQRRAGLLEGVPFQLEMRCLWKDGGYRWHLAQYKPLKDEHGRIIRWYATVTDIDDLKHAEQKLRQSEENLRAITDSIRQSIVVLAPACTRQEPKASSRPQNGPTEQQHTQGLPTRRRLESTANASAPSSRRGSVSLDFPLS